MQLNLNPNFSVKAKLRDFFANRRGELNQKGLVLTILISALTFFAYFWIQTATSAAGPVQLFIEYIVIASVFSIVIFYLVGGKTK
jgi:hypothetical protein